MKPADGRGRSRSVKRKASVNTSSSAVDDSLADTPQQEKASKQGSRKAKKPKKRTQEEGEEISARSSILHHFVSVERRHSVGEVGLTQREMSGSDSTMQASQSLFFSSPVQREVTMNDIMAKLETNSGKMNKIMTYMEKLESSLLQLEKENEELKAKYTEMKREGAIVRDTAVSARHVALTADERSNDNEQYCRNYNVRIYNVPENKEETVQQCEEKVLKLFNEKLGLKHITDKDLDAVHRLGKKKDEEPRPVIVGFISRKVRNQVIGKRRLLKKKPHQNTRPVTIVEDLTKKNYVLYQRARKSESAAECWTTMGKIFVKTKSGSVRRVRREGDITESSSSLGVRDSSPRQTQRACRACRCQRGSEARSPRPTTTPPQRPRETWREGAWCLWRSGVSLLRLG
jgi:hypothetical protein